MLLNGSHKRGGVGGGTATYEVIEQITMILHITMVTMSCRYVCTYAQRNLYIKDTLGPANLSIVERFVHSSEVKMY